jgi:hypothetical protein
MNKLKTKYKNMAQYKPEILSLSTALLAIHSTLATRQRKLELTKNYGTKKYRTSSY